MSEAQLENLKKARAKSVAKRKALKEAKDLEKQTAKLKREKAKEERLAKKLQQDEMIEMKAKLKMEAEQQANYHATWDEERLSKLMEKTLDNYLEKKKKAKELEARKPRQNIQTLVQPQQIPAQQNYPQQHYQQKPQPAYRQPTNYNFDENPFSRFM